MFALTHKVYQTLQEYCDPAAVIGSSTSGLKPSELQIGAARPDHIIVTHPSNPAYLLLSLVELAPTDQSSAGFVA